jgi:hypothetical protein
MFVISEIRYSKGLPCTWMCRDVPAAAACVADNTQCGYGAVAQLSATQYRHCWLKYLAWPLASLPKSVPLFLDLRPSESAPSRSGDDASATRASSMAAQIARITLSRLQRPVHWQMRVHYLQFSAVHSTATLLLWPRDLDRVPYDR